MSAPTADNDGPATGPVEQRATVWRPFTVATLAGCVAVVGALYGLGTGGPVPLTDRVVASVAGAFVVFVGILGWAITTATQHAGSQRLTAATWVTLSRGWALVLFAGVVTLGGSSERIAWLAVGLFGLSAVLDAADGWLARRTDTVSALGSRLDTETDALLVLVGTVAVVGLGSVPVVFLAVGLARYGFVAGVTLRRRRGQPLNDLAPSRFRQFTGAAIMGTIALGLLPAIDPTLSRAAGWLVTAPILAHFLWDWMAVSGRLD